MGWQTDIRKAVRQALNALCASGRLSRKGLIHSYNCVRLILPQRARQFRERRYGPDRDYFLYPVGFWDKGVWHLFTFYVNDAVEPGLLVVEDVEHEPK